MSREEQLEKSTSTDTRVLARSWEQRREARRTGWAASGTWVSLGIAGYLFVLAPSDAVVSAQRDSLGVVEAGRALDGITSPADRREAKKAEREARKAERARKKEERDAARAAKREEHASKSHGKTKGDDDNRTASKSKSKSDDRDSTVDLGGNDPLEGL